MDEQVSGAPRVRLGTKADLARVAPLWDALYAQQQGQGQLFKVPPDGFSSWAKALEPVLGRFGCLVVAERGDEVVGFVAGRTRALPAWSGGGQTGFVSDVFVAEGLRGAGLGKAMIQAAAGWFSTQGAKRLELQVIVGNTAAYESYRRMGWKDELVQMVLELPAR